MNQSSQTKRNIKKILGSRVFLFLAAIVLIILTVNLGRESYRKYQLGKEIQGLKAEMEQLEGKNRQLSDMFEYFKDESYLEQEARLKLNLKRPGEKVVIYSDRASDLSDNNSGASPTAPTAFGAPEIKKSEGTDNYWLWWEYFFDTH
jgi:cell division protein FtsB